MSFFPHVWFPIVITSAPAFIKESKIFLVIPIPWCLVYITDKPWGIILGIIVSLFSTVSIVYFIGLTKSETDFVKVLVRKLLKR